MPKDMRPRNLGEEVGGDLKKCRFDWGFLNEGVPYANGEYRFLDIVNGLVNGEENSEQNREHLIQKVIFLLRLKLKR